MYVDGENEGFSFKSLTERHASVRSALFAFNSADCQLYQPVRAIGGELIEQLDHVAYLSGKEIGRAHV